MNTPTLQDLKKAEQDLTLCIRKHMAEGDYELAADIKKQQRDLREEIRRAELAANNSIKSETHLHE